MMKKLLLSLSLLCVSVMLYGQKQQTPYLWPIKGAKAGSNMVSVPQGSIEGELNFDKLFIGAPEGTTVVSPVDGVISSFSLRYFGNLSSVVSWRCDDKGFDESLQKARADLVKSKDSRDPKYLSGGIGIRSNDGSMIYISGLSGSETFKTGQAIKRGDTIGKVAYSYYKIKEPAIHISISKGSKPADAMTPFGIKSSYIPYKEIKPITSLTKDKAKEDFLIYINALKELYPSLYDVITKEELEQYVAQTAADIDSTNGDVKFETFKRIMNGAVAKIHDSHIYFDDLSYKTNVKPSNVKAGIIFGLLNDTLTCTNAVKKYENLIGRRIKSINGLDTEAIKKIVLATVLGYDAGVQSFIDFHLAFASLYAKSNFESDLDVEFADGERLTIKAVNINDKLAHSFMPFRDINHHREAYITKILDDSTAYLGLFTFNLNQVQVEDIGRFIDSISGNKPNFIVDVRNNSGGLEDVTMKLYSYIAGEPFTINSYEKVNKRQGFESFRYSLNRMADDESFTHFKEEEGKDGFYDRPRASNTIVPDSAVSYKGRVYVLTNEFSTSAASLFPAMLIRNHRGVVVGRETRTAYHFMSASKFANIRLPNSMIAVTIPLVRCVFDTEVNKRVPYGRGVLPDYPYSITIDELLYKDGDAILNYTLNNLIRNGKYLSEDNPFKKP